MGQAEGEAVGTRVEAIPLCGGIRRRLKEAAAQVLGADMAGQGGSGRAAAGLPGRLGGMSAFPALAVA